MKKLSLIAMFVGLLSLTVMAVPAKRGVRTATQSDGTTLHYNLHGDEWHHGCVTSDGLTIARNAKGDFCYKTTNGLSAVIAHDINARSANEASFIEANKAQMTLSSQFTASKRARRAKAQTMRRASQVPQTGSPRIPVILVRYKDKGFISSNPVNTWTKQIADPNELSVRRYFGDQSFGKYTPQFDIYGVTMLKNNRVYYGGNDYNDEDKAVGEMVAEACLDQNPNIDFSRYDNDGDGECDVVVVLYAGDGEASSYADDYEDSVWPCQWDLYSSDYGRNLTLDGVTVSKFAVFNELYGETLDTEDGIGTMCHEFSHCIDLPDFYDTDYGNHFGMASWSLLDYGCYNNNGYTPAGYTAYERNFMGWFDYSEPVEGQTYTIPTVAEGGQAIKVSSSNPNEYYLLENIQQTGWNEYAPASGLQVTHVCYNATRWNNNEVNNYSDQGMTIIPADNSLKMEYYQGYYYVDEYDEIGDLYPYNGNNELTATSKPASTLYKSTTNLDKPITNITKNNDGTVSFTYMQKPIDTPVAAEAANITGNSFKASWSACEDALSYTLRVGKYVAPTYTLLMTEDFSNSIFTKETGTNLAGKLDQYMNNKGWTGSNLYAEPGGLRLGASKSMGTLTSPALDLSTSGGNVTIKFTAQTYGNDTDVSLKVSCGNNEQTVVLPSSAQDDYVVVLPCSETTGQKVTFATTANKKRVTFNDIKIYSGDASSEAAPVMTTDGDVITITGITATEYTVPNLTKETDYYYDVKAIYADGVESPWSNRIFFTTTSSVALPGDVNLDGCVDIADINIIINIILGADQAEKYDGRADIDNDGVIDIADLNAEINIILGK